MVIHFNCFFVRFWLVGFGFLAASSDGLKLKQSRAIDGLQFVCCQAMRGGRGRRLGGNYKRVYLQPSALRKTWVVSEITLVLSHSKTCIFN